MASSFDTSSCCLLGYVALNLELDAPIDTTTTMLVSTMPWESGTTEVVPGHSDGCRGTENPTSGSLLN